MQNILNIISVLAFVMTCVTWITEIHSKSIRLSVSAKDWDKKFSDIVQLYLLIQNNSKKPITISEIGITDHGQIHYCELVPKKILTKNDIVVRATPQFPLNLSPYQGILLAFEFLNCPNIELAAGKTVDLQIYTNLAVLKKSVILPKQQYYLRAKRR